MFIKICGITNEEDALLAVALGTDALGFVFAPSPRQMAPGRVHDIVRRLPPEVMTVGVFRNEHPDRVVAMMRETGLHAAQLHGHEPPEETRAVRAHTRLVIKAFAAGSDALTHAKEHRADIILLDSARPGSGTVFDWTLVSDVPQDARLLLAGGLTPENVATAIARVSPWGVDVSSGVERDPGRKDPVKLQRFIEAAREAAPAPYRGPDEMPYDWQDE
ncbi:MAG TPA: phosphoribosylanthranilate isomerase [Acidimicrobiales bacterium]